MGRIYLKDKAVPAQSYANILLLVDSGLEDLRNKYLCMLQESLRYWLTIALTVSLGVLGHFR